MNINTGILGLGSKSTLFYIEELNRLYKNNHGGYTTFPFKLLNTNFDQINSLLPNYSDELDNIVMVYLNELIALNVDSILIPNITLHETIDEIMKREKYNISIIHPLLETTNKLNTNQVKEVVLFGTSYTMNSTYISSFFKKNGIIVTKPSQEDMEKIDGMRKEVYAGNNIGKNTKLLHELTKQYSLDQEVTTDVVIACTELSMINPESNPRNYDMAKIQLQETLRRSSI